MAAIDTQDNGARVITIKAISPDDPNIEPCDHYHVLAQQRCGCDRILGMPAAAEYCRTVTQEGDCAWEWRYGWGGFAKPAILATPAQAKQLADDLIRAGSTNPGIGSEFRHRHPHRLEHRYIDLPFTEVTPDTIWILTCHEHCVFDYMLDTPSVEIGEPYWHKADAA